jgi:hypothetical protein
MSLCSKEYRTLRENLSPIACLTSMILLHPVYRKYRTLRENLDHLESGMFVLCDT